MAITYTLCLSLFKHQKTTSSKHANQTFAKYLYQILCHSVKKLKYLTHTQILKTMLNLYLQGFQHSKRWAQCSIQITYIKEIIGQQPKIWMVPKIIFKLVMNFTHLEVLINNLTWTTHGKNMKTIGW